MRDHSDRFSKDKLFNKSKKIFRCLRLSFKKVKLGSLYLKEKENTLNEVRIIASIKCPYIISYKDTFYEETTNSLNIIMEFA